MKQWYEGEDPIAAAKNARREDRERIEELEREVAALQAELDENDRHAQIRTVSKRASQEEVAALRELEDIMRLAVDGGGLDQVGVCNALAAIDAARGEAK